MIPYGDNPMDELSHISDKEYAFALAKSHYKELLDAGVSVYEYTPPRFCPCKDICM